MPIQVRNRPDALNNEKTKSNKIARVQTCLYSKAKRSQMNAWRAVAGRGPIQPRPPQPRLSCSKLEWRMPKETPETFPEGIATSIPNTWLSDVVYSTCSKSQAAAKEHLWLTTISHPNSSSNGMPIRPKASPIPTVATTRPPFAAIRSAICRRGCIARHSAAT